MFACRFIKSFDENAVTRLFTERRDRIKAIEQRMRRTVEQRFRQNLPNIMIESLHRYFKGEGLIQLGESISMFLDQTGLRHNMHRNESPHQVATPAVSERLPTTSRTTSHSAILDNPQPLDCYVSDRHTTSDNLHVSVLEETEVSTGCYNRQSILGSLDPIVEGFHKAVRSISDITSHALNLTVDNQVKRHIDDWIINPLGKAIWIQGPHDVSRGSQNTLTAACLIAVSGQNSVPCIFYFCSLKTPPYSEPSCLSCQEILLDMIKSFTIQLLLLAPENIITELDLSPSRLAKLLDPNLDIKATLQIFLDVRTFAPPYLHCIVEGVQELEDRTDTGHTRFLFRALHEIIDFPTSRTPWEAGSIRRSDPGDEKLRLSRAAETEQSQLTKVTKVCFFTDGYMDALSALASQDRLDKVEYAEESHEPGAEEGSRLVSSWDEE